MSERMETCYDEEAESRRRSCHMGIDPGQSGAVVVLDADRVYSIRCDSTEADIAAFFEAHAFRTAFATIERVGANRGPDGRRQGASSMFTFGTSYGFLRGCLAMSGIPFEEVQPVKWQAAFSLCRTDKNESTTDKKRRHKARAQQLFTSQTVTNYTADALLLAEYCRRKRTGTL